MCPIWVSVFRSSNRYPSHDAHEVVLNTTYETKMLSFRSARSAENTDVDEGDDELGESPRSPSINRYDLIVGPSTMQLERLMWFAIYSSSIFLRQLGTGILRTPIHGYLFTLYQVISLKHSNTILHVFCLFVHIAVVSSNDSILT